MDLLKAMTGTLSPELKAAKWEGARNLGLGSESLTLDNAVRFGFKIGLGFILANVVVGTVVGVFYFALLFFARL